MDPVKQITVRVVAREMGGAVWNPRTRWTSKVMLFAFVEDTAGRIGVGEAWLNEGGARAVRAVIEDDMAPLVVGRCPFEARGIAETMRRGTEISGRVGITAAAWSAVDIALWDLAARQVNLPLVDLLGRARKTVPVYASAGLYGTDKSADDLAAEVKGWVDDGFDAVKIKVGGAPLAEDVRRIAAVREAIGPDVRFMIDALYNLDVAGALALANAAAPYDIHFLEAPVSPLDIAGQARVHAQSPIPVCGNESMAWASYFRDLITADAVHYVQFDPAACGGVTEAKRIGELAHAFHLPATLHASSSVVTYAASLHVACSLPNAHSTEHHMLHQWFWEKAPAGTFEPAQSALAPPPGPGLGIDLTPDDL
ncbi:mandelate racemase/muconate lactonizing enzyme family protein [Acuticoccus sp. MNP-M23]|uniref:mandelate racemase/muconate lactonizing enzyme family protein n=1 Tax=Acuticoccus sp. MNP-M23 TaxID=3072793 RepID=UPI00281616BA|nr:mandelate racemase/muconate lactonizing enzyme family protein [Acuticoccus sp. MNP-M23]WMS43681.1 mandelate racemase/muconate lactonizing enzyme family protein [Acuticoccus sp. MNP-M23]